MPTYTVEAFRWSGTGYRSEYNTSYQATFTDDDGAYQGSGDSNEQVQIDNGSVNGTSSQPYKIAVSFTDTSGNSHVEDFNFFYTSDGGWYFVPEPGSEFTVGATLGSYQSHTVGWSYDDVVCFVSGTLIDTPNGQRPVESLSVGDLVTCQDGSAKPLTQVVTRQFRKAQLRRNEKLRPVRITAGSLGLGVPTRDLLVSRQHRMVTKSQISKRIYGAEETLVSAIRLTELPGIYVEADPMHVTYYHLGFEAHEVVFAEGAPAESLLQGDEAYLDDCPEAREELMWLLPDSQIIPKLVTPTLAIPSGKTQKKIILKHLEKELPVRQKKT